MLTAPHIAAKTENRNHLAKLRRQARKRGFRVLKDWQGTFSLVDTKIEPQRALLGLAHVPLEEIATAVLAPLPERSPRRRRIVPNPVVQPDFIGPVIVEIDGRAA